MVVVVALVRSGSVARSKLELEDSSSRSASMSSGRAELSSNEAPSQARVVSGVSHEWKNDDGSATVVDGGKADDVVEVEVDEIEVDGVVVLVMLLLVVRRDDNGEAPTSSS